MKTTRPPAVLPFVAPSESPFLRDWVSLDLDDGPRVYYRGFAADPRGTCSICPAACNAFLAQSGRWCCMTTPARPAASTRGPSEARILSLN